MWRLALADGSAGQPAAILFSNNLIAGNGLGLSSVGVACSSAFKTIALPKLYQWRPRARLLCNRAERTEDSSRRAAQGGEPVGKRPQSAWRNAGKASPGAVEGLGEALSHSGEYHYRFHRRRLGNDYERASFGIAVMEGSEFGFVATTTCEPPSGSGRPRRRSKCSARKTYFSAIFKRRGTFVSTPRFFVPSPCFAKRERSRLAAMRGNVRAAKLV